MSEQSPYDRRLRQLAGLEEKNRRLTESLVAARQQLIDLRSQLAAMASPPLAHAIFAGANQDGTVDIWQLGRRWRVSLTAGLNTSDLSLGQTVVLNEAMAVVAVEGFGQTGQAVRVLEVLDQGRVVVLGQGDGEMVGQLAGPVQNQTIRPGDTVLFDPRSLVVFEVLVRSQAEDLVLEDVPDVTYQDIGGLDQQISLVRDAVELPFSHPELFSRYQLRAPKGVLLYGPPGCGKTLIAKAVARSLAARAPGAGPACFLNIKGPELLNKYVGETERHLRAIFARARQKAQDGGAVVVFFDEMESLFRTRGTGLSSDVETTVVPQLLAEIDGVEALSNVIVIGASNREDLIDPAILRPGRLDVKIRVDRPNQAGAAQIFGKYLTADLPLAPTELEKYGQDRQAVIAAMIEQVTSRLYDTGEQNRFLEVTYANSETEVLYYKDFVSGAMIKAVVDRAKQAAIKSQLTSGSNGLTLAHLCQALTDELEQNEDLPGTTNPDDWSKVSGRKGQPIVFLRSLTKQGRQIEI